MIFKNENAQKCYKETAVKFVVSLAVLICSAAEIIVEKLILKGETSWVTALAVFCLFISALYTLANGVIFYSFKKLNKCDKSEIQEIENDMASGEWYPASRLYMTDTRFISFSPDPKWMLYTDIAMMYKYISKQNGITMSEGIKILYKNGTDKMLSEISLPILHLLRSREFDRETEIIMAKAKEKNPEIFMGYDPVVLRTLKANAKNNGGKK